LLTVTTHGDRLVRKELDKDFEGLLQVQNILDVRHSREVQSGASEDLQLLRLDMDQIVFTHGVWMSKRKALDHLIERGESARRRRKKIATVQDHVHRESSGRGDEIELQAAPHSAVPAPLKIRKWVEVPRYEPAMVRPNQEEEIRQLMESLVVAGPSTSEVVDCELNEAMGGPKYIDSFLDGLRKEAEMLAAFGRSGPIVVSHPGSSKMPVEAVIEETSEITSMIWDRGEPAFSLETIGDRTYIDLRLPPPTPPTVPRQFSGRLTIPITVLLENDIGVHALRRSLDSGHTLVDDEDTEQFRVGDLGNSSDSEKESLSGADGDASNSKKDHRVSINLEYLRNLRTPGAWPE
jgi:hypothetical protein